MTCRKYIVAKEELGLMGAGTQPSSFSEKAVVS